MKVIFDDAEYDRVLADSLPDYRDCSCAIFVKDGATVDDDPVACITFMALTLSGSVRVTKTVSVRDLMEALRDLADNYERLLDSRWATKNTPERLSGHVDGVEWSAMRLDGPYLVGTASHGFGLAVTEEDILTVAEGLIRGNGRG